MAPGSEQTVSYRGCLWECLRGANLGCLNLLPAVHGDDFLGVQYIPLLGRLQAFVVHCPGLLIADKL
eukprot:11226602-Lingulodinium_polyedra.AAC.1